MLLKIIYYGFVLFALALGVSFAIRLVRTGLDACFNGSPIGLLYILAVYFAFYLLAKFLLNRKFSRSSQVVTVLAVGNTCYALIGLASHYGIHPMFTIIFEAAGISVFILFIRGCRGASLFFKGKFPNSLIADYILDDCVVYNSGWRGFQAFQFAEVTGEGAGSSILLSCWEKEINLSFEVYRRGKELRTLVSVWGTSRDFGDAVKLAREKMQSLRKILRREGYDTRVISDELEVERCLYLPLLAPDCNRVHELREKYFEELKINELDYNSDVEQALNSILFGKNFGEESVGYILLLQPVRDVDIEFMKAEKELKDKIEKLVTKRFKKNDPAAWIAISSLSQEKSLILEPSMEKALKESRVKCQRMMEAQNIGLWNSSIFLVGGGETASQLLNQVGTKQSRECLYNLIRRRKHREKYSSRELSQILPVKHSTAGEKEPSPCQEEVI
ncbi:MAG: hypothetical protein KIH08_02835 [Candidatus Freyarchaeota archaeon]|nr:hypothetical protein [Candidatus Jordarchaeia archaeon]MBS7267926.1 hypothetical protein [Candidatus Jordarchaeia archaeon]MBS7280504.1 hypothetical protein [Candidatus Jordarchaeia archaeon]